jgi:hypothetical protein
LGSGTTRRQFLARGGAVAGALALGGAAAVVAPSRGTAEAVGLTAARERTYTALMEAVLVQPSLRLDPALAPRAADAFAAVYADWPAEQRHHADAVLDALERAPGAAGFSALGPDDRAAQLRAGARVTRARPTPDDRDRLQLTTGALELAAAVLGPPDSGHQLVTVT